MIATIIFCVLCVLFLVVLLRLFLSRRRLIKLFEDTSVCVGGARGSGKDMLFNFVVDKRNCSYISNVNYANTKVAETPKRKDCCRIDFDPIRQWSCGGNNFIDFVNGSLKPYTYPYEDGIDYYISDGGVYFPAQEVNSLNKLYKSFPIFQALARHLGDCNIHVNVQSFNRLWDKIREQFETYILCRSCKVIGRFVIQRVRVYDRYQSAVDKVRPMKRRFGRAARVEFDKYTAQYGTIQNLTLVYFLKHKYDSRRFQSILRGENNEIETQVVGDDQKTESR